MSEDLDNLHKYDYRYKSLPNITFKNVSLGYCSAEKSKLIFDTIRMNKQLMPHRAVEIGVHFGSSFIPMCIAVQGAGTCTGIDPYASYVQKSLPMHQNQLNQLNQDEAFEYVQEQLVKYNLFCGRIIRNFSANVPDSDIPSGITFLHIDGNHDYMFALKDILLYTHRVVVGGHVLVDDIQFPDVAKAVRETLANDNKWTKIDTARSDLYVLYKRIM